MEMNKNVKVISTSTKTWLDNFTPWGIFYKSILQKYLLTVVYFLPTENWVSSQNLGFNEQHRVDQILSL